tara:strand:- start:3753 stop:4085 length:333 start_codon:yes stop_codon:yes gene_type:complete
MTSEKIPFEDWQKLDLRVAKILEVEDIEGKDKLYKLKISLGDEERTLVAGLKQVYPADSLINKKIIVIANLEPAKLAGIESNGMLLAASDDNTLALLTPEKDVKEGSKIS